jgi:hypothetical protein
MFVNRRTGGITVAQWPNVALSVFIITVIGRQFDRTSGPFHDFLVVLGTAALVVWALDELIRGVNPFRRLLGLVVLLATLSSLVR